ncbi:hCG1787807 [Homo sapiens]|nr:hCG1787807 [Homo sapiens]
MPPKPRGLPRCPPCQSVWPLPGPGWLQVVGLPFPLPFPGLSQAQSPCFSFPVWGDRRVATEPGSALGAAGLQTWLWSCSPGEGGGPGEDELPNTCYGSFQSQAARTQSQRSIRWGWGHVGWPWLSQVGSCQAKSYAKWGPPWP